MPYPNVRVRLRRTTSAPGAEIESITMTIYLRDRRFRIVDESGRGYGEIVDDVTSPRGFGATPKTMEEFMDASQRSRRTDRPPVTELRGDLARGEASVREGGEPPWPVDPDRLVPVAEQILFDSTVTWDLAPEPTARWAESPARLGRAGVEYWRTLEGDEDGYPYRSQVRLLVSDPFVLVREVVDSVHPDLFARVEVLDLDEGVVDDNDLA